MGVNVVLTGGVSEKTYGKSLYIEDTTARWSWVVSGVNIVLTGGVSEKTYGKSLYIEDTTTRWSGVVAGVVAHVKVILLYSVQNNTFYNIPQPL